MEADTHVMGIEIVPALHEAATADVSRLPHGRGGEKKLNEEELPKFDPVRFQQGMKKWTGAFRERMLAEGYNSTAELMADLRGQR